MSTASVCQGESLRRDGWWPAVIDRVEDGDADADRPARVDPADGERAAAPPAGAPETSAEQRAAACRRYRETVDHTFDIARADSGRQSPASADGSGGPAPETPADDAPDPDSPGDASDQNTDGRGPDAESPDSPDGGERQSWAEAVVELRAAWEKHEQLYPERSRLAPTAQPDGGWRADGDRGLTPEQNAEAGKACEDIRAEGTEVILPAMERIEAADPDRRLAGLDHMLKGEDRLKEKIADEMAAKAGLSVASAMDTVVDPVRFTFTYSSERYAEGTLSDVERLKSEGFELVKLKNLWADDQYKGINSQWRRPDTGLRFEVQFHTPESLEAKELTHRAYERIRSTASPGERRELKAFQRQVNAQLDTPPGTAEIRDFPEKR